MQPGGAPLAPLAPLTPRAAPPAGEKYAFVTLPYAEFVEGTINEDNIGFGALCPLPAGGLPADALVHGLVIFSKRSAAISAWLTGIDLVFVKASLETREVLLEVGLDTQHAQQTLPCSWRSSCRGWLTSQRLLVLGEAALRANRTEGRQA